MILQITGGSVQVDQLDYEWARVKHWAVSDLGYARTRANGRGPIRMHRLILERMLGRPLTSTEYVDHVNMDKLDNRRGNLRVATKSQNGMNIVPRNGCTSRFKGVCYDASRHGYMAYINVDHKRQYLGRFNSEKEAAWMRDQFAIQLHGEYARLNFDYEVVA